MSYDPIHPQGGPAGAQPNMNISFNQMLQRSQQDQRPQEAPVEAPGHPAPAIAGYRGVYNATPPPQQLPPNALGGARAPSSQPILPVDLPPQAFLTSSMLLDMVDKKVDVLLRDEKEYIGILRSYDQFANLVLTECSERIAARNPEASTDTPTPKWLICDVKLPGLMTIRGENVTICATVDLDREDEPKGVKFAPEEEVRELANAQRNQKKASEARKAKAFKAAGIEAGFGMAA
ncbi:LSM domain-containing protein [Paraphaeosphaeria sporulosa]